MAKIVKQETVKVIFRGSAHIRFHYKGIDYALTPGHKYELPADAEYVQSLIAQNILKTTNTK